MTMLFLLFAFIQLSIAHKPWKSSNKDCDCCTVSDSFYSYDPDKDYSAAKLCGPGYRFPEPGDDYDEYLAKECMSPKQKKALDYYGDEYFVLTTGYKSRCYGSKCKEYALVCIKKSCNKDTKPQTCPKSLIYPTKKESFEFVFVVDNSCGLTKDECKVQRKAVADLFWKVKVDNKPYVTKVAFVEYCEKGAKVQIGFDDSQYQKNKDKYYDWIRYDSPCGKGGDGKTDLLSGLELAVEELTEDGCGSDAYRKIILINNCENTEDGCEDPICKGKDSPNYALRDPKNFETKPDVLVFNVPPKCDDEPDNAISKPKQYLKCLVKDESQGVCLNLDKNDEITKADYWDAVRTVPDEYDECADDDILCDFFGCDNDKDGEWYSSTTDSPQDTSTTEYSTSEYSTSEYSTTEEWPTKKPSKKKKCFEIKFEKNKKCKSRWVLKEEKKNGDVVKKGNAKWDKCVKVDCDEDYELTVKDACGKVRWFYDGKQIGSYDFEKKYDSKSFNVKTKKCDYYW